MPLRFATRGGSQVSRYHREDLKVCAAAEEEHAPGEKALPGKGNPVPAQTG
jgi:hypothetical protein